MSDVRGTKIDVLDKGYVMLKDYMGSDLEPVNDARVSYNKESKEFTERDLRLLNFLAREDHTSPFRHSILKFEVFAPLMIARQWWKYVIGSDHAEDLEKFRDPFLAWNESSRRYITEEPQFYVVRPNEWRSKPENSKQGSGEPLPLEIGSELTERLVKAYNKGLEDYEYALSRGVAPEQARLFLNAYGLYVRWRWTASLQGVMHLLNQRLAHDAQKEFQSYAQAIYDLTKLVFPNSMEAFLNAKKVK